jgi:hypothetical protein
MLNGRRPTKARPTRPHSDSPQAHRPGGQAREAHTQPNQPATNQNPIQPACTPPPSLTGPTTCACLSTSLVNLFIRRPCPGEKLTGVKQPKYELVSEPHAFNSFPPRVSSWCRTLPDLALGGSMQPCQWSTLLPFTRQLIAATTMRAQVSFRPTRWRRWRST